jgi:osmotically-inducible protein OsmY
MNSKSLLAAIFAACVLLAYGPVASADVASQETDKRTEPARSDKNRESEESESEGSKESWFSGEASPDEDTAAERRAEQEIVEGLDPVEPGETRPSPGQARQESGNESRSAADRCLASTIEAVLNVDRAGRASGLSVDAQDGVVSLSGTLADQASIEHVRKLVAGVKGVNGVDTSGLTTSRTASRPE